MDLEVNEHVYSISRLELFEEWVKHGKENRNTELFAFLSSRYDFSGITDESLRTVKQAISAFSSNLDAIWYKSKKCRDVFLIKNAEWTSKNFVFKVHVTKGRSLSHLHTPSTSAASSAPAGRPSKKFDDSSDKTKKRKVADLLCTRDTNQLLLAAEVSARLSGHRNLAAVIRDASESPEKCKKIKNSASASESSQRCLTKEEALAYYVDSKSTSHSYELTRKWSMKVGHMVFPSIHSVRQAKRDCFPLEDHIFVDETRADIQLQAILNKTVERLVHAQQEVFKSSSLGSSFTLVSKWGCDGSSGHSTYKQKFASAEATDEYLFVFSFVPLQLQDESGNIAWQNPRSSSTMYCRPIKFIFSKETTEFTVAETNKVLEEINQLVPTICHIDDKEVSVKHKLLFTMIDGKVCNAVTETTSSQKCYICGATPKLMNDESREYVVNRDNLGFGISTLHAWIRCFECLLHISYRLEVKKWQIRDPADKAHMKQRSTNIQNRFKSDMGLIVDKPKPGFGNTNDGNTARRFFGNPELSADITGIDVKLIKNFDIILRTLASGYDINTDKFELLAQETRHLYISLYPWYYMPATVHKILVHSTDIIKSALLPIGQLSEEAQEARNKDCRRFREHNTRKQSRIATNTDLLHMLLITSDPVVNSHREVPKKKTGQLPSEVLDLIIAPTVNICPNATITSPDVSLQDYTVDDSSDEEISDSEN